MWGASVVQSLHSACMILQYRDQILLMSAYIHTNIVECLDCDLLEG